jgi:hypothetical protein
MEDVGLFYDHLVHFVGIWYIFPILVCCTKKNLATLLVTLARMQNSRSESGLKNVLWQSFRKRFSNRATGSKKIGLKKTDLAQKSRP